MIFVGVDWAEDHHDVCVMDLEGTVLGKRPVDNRQLVVEFGTVTHGGGLPLSKRRTSPRPSRDLLWTATRMARPLATPVDPLSERGQMFTRPSSLYEEGPFVKDGGGC